MQSPCLHLSPRLSITNCVILAHYLNSLCLVLLIGKMGIIVPPSEGCVRMERNNISLEQPLISMSSIIIIIVSTIFTMISLAAAASPSIPCPLTPSPGDSLHIFLVSFCFPADHSPGLGMLPSHSRWLENISSSNWFLVSRLCHNLNHT